jgi:site-specific DNA-methyltransferase (adenine-specific)
MTQKIRLWVGDSAQRLLELETNSISAVVCDPPYGLEFMAPDWTSFRLDKCPSGLFKIPDSTPRWSRIPLSVLGQLQGWHAEWLSECFRVLRPGGVLKVSSTPRIFHRLARAAEQVGFREILFETWVYATGFPKGLDVAQSTGDPQFRGYNTSLKPSWEPFLVARKP